MSGESFKCGELILTSKPFVYVLNNTERGKRCDYCFVRSETVKRCANCSFSYFCNKECQVARPKTEQKQGAKNGMKILPDEQEIQPVSQKSKAWEDHKDECKGLKKVYPKEPTPSLRLLAQIILKIKRLGVEEPNEIVGGSKIAFKNLESHADEVKNDLRCRQQMVAFVGTLKDFIGEKNIPPPSEFTEIFGKMVINTFSIWDAEMQSIGSGLYLGASIFDHSCDPDAEVLFSGPVLNARMVRDVPHRDYRRVYISYIDQMQLTEERQKHLREQYYFTCMCPRCTDPYYDALMKKLFVDDNSGKCVESSSAKEIERIKQMKRDKASPFQLLRACQKEMEAQDGVLADTHVSRVRLLEIAFDCYVQLNQWMQAIEIGIQLIRPYKLYYGHYHPNVCIQLFKIGKIEHLIGRLKEAEKHLLEAEEAMSISHGHNHPLYQDLLLLLHMCQQEVSVS